MIRVAVIDDHPALRAGLRTVIATEPGIVFAGDSAGDEESVWPMLVRTRPDVALVDYHLPKGDGLQLCYRLKQRPPAPKVLIYSAYASAPLALTARLARADGLLDKGAQSRALFEAIRRIYKGEDLLPPLSRAVLDDAHRRLDASQRPIVAMLVDGATDAEIAGATGKELPEIRHAVARLLTTLRLEVPPVDTAAQ